MRLRKRGLLVAGAMAVLLLVASACSDVSSSSSSAASGSVPDNSGTTINFSVSPWQGSAANVAIAQKLLEDKLGYTVKTTDIDEYAQFPALANGDLDATLEVWPSGHAKDYKKYIDVRQRRRRRRPARRDRADRVVDPDVPADGPPGARDVGRHQGQRVDVQDGGVRGRGTVARR